jgi:hypothetical protein
MDAEEAGDAILRNLAALDGYRLGRHFEEMEKLGPESPHAARQQLTDKLLAALALPQIQH